MKTTCFPRVLMTGLIVCGLIASALAKPPKKIAPEASPAPSPVPAPPANTSALARWLVEQDGGPESIALPLAEVVRAATGKTLLPMDPANPGDAAIIAKLGGAMDRILPGMNKPESPAHVVGRLEEVAAFFEDALGAFTAAETLGSGFPAVRLADAATGKTYYLAVTLYPTEGREAAVRALRFEPAAGRARISGDGAGVLVAVEYNGKTGKEIAFLNWELLDLAKMPVHVATVFDGSQADAHPPGSVLGDGRKGRD